MLSLETARLKIIPLTRPLLKKLLDDTPALEAELHLSPSGMVLDAHTHEAMQYLFDLAAKTPKSFPWITNWQIIEKERNIAIGSACFMNVPNEKGEVEIGYGIYHAFQNQGFMTEALEALCRWAENQPGVTAIRAETEPANIASHRVLEKCAFQSTNGQQFIRLAKRKSETLKIKNLIWRRAKSSDAEILVELYNAAFHDDFIRYGECPAYGRTPEQMRSSIARFPKEIAFVNAVPVGVISWRAQGNGDYEVGCLCVRPEWQHKGIGFAALEHMQMLLADWRRISLITPADKEENICFYTKKCGFRMIDQAQDGAVKVACLCKTRMYLLETERLFLREMTQADFPALCKILRDEAVMYAYEGAFSDAEVQVWLDNQLRRYREDNVGLWAVILKSNNTMIGQCGLTIQPWKERKLLEVGYLFQKAYWHCGYATEAAQACRDYAFQTLHAEAVYSIIRDTNTASRHVAERNGMTVVDHGIKHYRGINMPHLLYEIKQEK